MHLSDFIILHLAIAWRHLLRQINQTNRQAWGRKKHRSMANIQDHQAKEFLKQLIQRGQWKAAVDVFLFSNKWLIW